MPAKKAGAVAATEARWPADAVERRPVAALVPYARNARTHSDEQVAQIAASIREWGWTMPVLVDEAGTIIAGHGRVLAAQSLGIAEVPVMVAAGWSEAQKRAYVIADNKLALNAGWDEELLPVELGDLKGLGVRPRADRLRRTRAGQVAARQPMVTAIRTKRPSRRPSRSASPAISGSAASTGCCAATRRSAPTSIGCSTASWPTWRSRDPPYNVNYANSAKDKLRGKNRPILNDALGEGFGAFLQAASANMLAVTKGAIYICMSSSELDTLQKAFREAGGKWSTFVIWAKNTFTLGRADYQRQYEPILYGWKDGAEHFWCGARDQGDVWFFDKPAKNDLHPTMKPVALVERAIRNSSKSRDIVLDPFGGSGTTMIAAERTGRRARLVELEPRYVDVIVRRWEELTGGQAQRSEA